MKLAFTICSNNYLAQAKVLGDTFLENNPEYKFVIGLCDRPSSEIDYRFFDKFEILSFENIGIENLQELIDKYDIVELNTAIKASYFKYFIATYPDLKSVFYFDPDIQIFSSVESLEFELTSNDIILTPHILNPMPVDDISPSENKFLVYGVYNLGFIGLKADSSNVRLFLDWWEERTFKRGFNDRGKGQFVDQLWITLVPVLFDRVKILKDYGLNVAPWNIHERLIEYERNGNYYFKNNSKLIFFHFSNFKYLFPDIISKSYDRYRGVDLKYVNTIYQRYYIKLIENNIETYSKILFAFNKPKPPDKSIIKKILLDLAPPLTLKIYDHVKTLLSKTGQG